MTILLVCGIVWANPSTHTVRRVCYPASIIRQKTIAGRPALRIA